MEPVTTNLIGRAAIVDGEESQLCQIAAVGMDGSAFKCLVIDPEANLREIEARRLTVVGDDER